MVKYLYDKHQVLKEENLYYVSNEMYDWVPSMIGLYFHMDNNSYGNIKFSSQSNSGTPDNPYYLFEPTNPTGNRNRAYRYDTSRPDDRYYRYTFFVENATYRLEHLEIRVAEKKGVFIESITAEEGAYPDDGKKGEFWYVKKGVANATPSIVLSTTNNQTLYENGSLNVSGNTKDEDIGDAVTVKYQINNGAVRTLSTAISNGATLPFTKNLTFKNKRLYDGAVVVSDELNGGTNHTLKVWAEDDGGGKSAVQTRTFQVVPNRPPTITLNTEANKKLYERDKLLIYGTAKDVDSGDSVTVRFQINSGAVRNIHSAISDGSTNISFDKELTYTDGVLKDGNTVLTSALGEGSPHTLSVWSEDGNGGKSAVQTRTFHVVPNRPPTISVNPIAPKSDLINSETLEISGNVADLDDNNVTITFSINGGEEKNVRSGRPGPFSFNIMLKDLVVGSNRIEIKAKDVYQAEVVKIVTINKIHDAVPINQAIALYKISPPSGNAQKILLWIERQLGDLSVIAEVSMTNGDEPENFVSIERTNSELKGVLQEDEFAYDAHESKNNIIVKIIYNRNDSESMEAIKKISGVLS